MFKSENMTLLTDLYQLTMMQGYFEFGKKDKLAVFDLFFRENPFHAAFSIAAGLDQLIDYIENLHFSDEDIRYLRSTGLFTEGFLEYLSDFHFSGEIYAIPEGSIVFPGEPLVRVKAPIVEAQLIETTILCLINHQSLIATKAVRVNWAAKGDPVMEFGLRRAQGPDAGTLGARAAVIGGCVGTSNVLCAKEFDVAPKGTHAHSWVMSFDHEIDAFRAYAKLFPDMCILLVDTYDTLGSGVPNAIKVFQEMRDAGVKSKTYGVRLDSGDLAYLSKKARAMLDEAGFTDAIISASSDLDEYLVRDLKLQGAEISLWGIGTKLITAQDNPSFGGVYKLAAEEIGADEEKSAADGGAPGLKAKIKLSDNPAKVTNPGYKKVLRIYDRATGKLKADLITLNSEQYSEDEVLTIFDPISTWKRMTFAPASYELREMLQPIFIDGRCVYERPSVMEIQAYCKRELETLWPESRRLVNAQTIPVDLSQPLYDLKQTMLHQYRKDNL